MFRFTIRTALSRLPYKTHFFYYLGEYCEWALKHKHTLQIAHNLKGYDGAFILKFFWENSLPCESIRSNINRLMKLNQDEIEHSKIVLILKYFLI